MGWFFENKAGLVPTGTVIAREQVTGSRLTALGKIAAFALVIWLFGADHGDGAQQTQPRPGVTQSVPSPRPHGPETFPR